MAARFPYKPLADNVIVEAAPDNDKTKSGLTVVKGEKHITEGVVVARGPKVLGVNEGDHVVFSPYAVGNTLNDIPGRRMMIVLAEEELKVVVDDAAVSDALAEEAAKEAAAMQSLLAARESVIVRS